MSWDLLVPTCVVEGPLSASVNAAHGQPVWLVEVWNRVVMLPLPVLHHQVGVGPEPVHRQLHRPAVGSGIPYEPLETVLTQSALVQDLVAEVQDVLLIAGGA